MRRIQFIEIHEQPWLPSLLRDGITDSLRFGLNLFHAYSPIAPRLQRALDLTHSQSIVDLCSGGGGPWIDLSGRLRGSDGRLQIWLTDKYPNLGAVRNAASDSEKSGSENRISVYPKSVDAMGVPRELKGLRTIFTAFHHFAPDEARAILQNAVDANESIAIFEITRRAPATVAFMLPYVFLLTLCAPWIRPFRWSRLLLTYVVPVIPLLLFFDGVVSCLRTYRPPELREIVAQLKPNQYRWEIDEQLTGKMPITCLIGTPEGTIP